MHQRPSHNDSLYTGTLAAVLQPPRTGRTPSPQESLVSTILVNYRRTEEFDVMVAWMLCGRRNVETLECAVSFNGQCDFSWRCGTMMSRKY